MKKFIIIFAILFGFTTMSSAQDVEWLKAYELAVKINNEWSDWEDVNINVKIDFSNDRIVIYSVKTQIYEIIREIEAPYDSSGEQLAFRVIDQDDDVGRFRFRVQDNGTKQIYIDFDYISWVYNVR